MFESAVDSIIEGNLSALEALLAQDPSLVQARSTRPHKATLLHYIGANGVEDHRQKTPPNAPLIAATLLNAGAEVDAIAFLYGTSTTLSLVATSIHPQKAGVQPALINLLIDAGASIEGILTAAITNCRAVATETLLKRGAPVDNIIAAAALGNLPLTESLLPQSDQMQKERAFIYACLYGQTEIASFLLDQGVDPTAATDMGQTGMHFAADGGHLAAIQMLIERKVPLNVKNKYGGTVLGQALWSAANEPKPSHPAIIEALEKAS